MITPSEFNKTRKRIKSNKREIAKRKRYTAKVLPIFPKCGHAGKPYQPFKCISLLTMRDIKYFYDSFYKNCDKVIQDFFLLKHCSVSAPKRCRKRKEENNKPKSLCVTYHVKRKDGLMVTVCRQSFLDILSVKKDRILKLLKRYKETNEMPKERRGGDQVKEKNTNKRIAISNFVESLKCTESHYCRSKTFQRFYLPAELSIRKLWKMYNNTVIEALKVKESFFRYFFTRKYNVVFGTPKTDLCSTCLQFKDVIKKTTDADTQKKLVLQNKIHKVRANCFYQLLKKENGPEVVTFSFDCQKNLILPKLPDQACYFTMQLNFFHFAIVEGSSKEKLNPNTVRSYVWTELDHPRGSNEIASALHHTLISYEFSNDTKIVRLFCDECGAQNKNTTVIGMLSSWLLKSSLPTIEKIEVVFPVVGHSYIPPDRLFGQIEKDIKKKPEITSPEQYIEIIKKWTTIDKLGVDAPLHDWKSEIHKVMKQPGQWHFKFQMSKRIIISKTKDKGIEVRGESFYMNNLGTNQSLLKRGRKWVVNPKVAELGIPVKPDKRTSITKLILKHFGDTWKNDKALLFFKNAFDEIPVVAETPKGDENPEADENPVATTSNGSCTRVEEQETDDNTEKFCFAEDIDFDI